MKEFNDLADRLSPADARTVRGIAAEGYEAGMVPESLGIPTKQYPLNRDLLEEIARRLLMRGNRSFGFTALGLISLVEEGSNVNISLEEVQAIGDLVSDENFLEKIQEEQKGQILSRDEIGTDRYKQVLEAIDALNTNSEDVEVNSEHFDILIKISPRIILIIKREVMKKTQREIAEKVILAGDRNRSPSSINMYEVGARYIPLGNIPAILRAYDIKIHSHLYRFLLERFTAFALQRSLSKNRNEIN